MLSTGRRCLTIPDILLDILLLVETVFWELYVTSFLSSSLFFILFDLSLIILVPLLGLFLQNIY